MSCSFSSHCRAINYSIKAQQIWLSDYHDKALKNSSSGKAPSAQAFRKKRKKKSKKEINYISRLEWYASQMHKNATTQKFVLAIMCPFLKYFYLACKIHVCGVSAFCSSTHSQMHTYTHLHIELCRDRHERRTPKSVEPFIPSMS